MSPAASVPPATTWRFVTFGHHQPRHVRRVPLQHIPHLASHKHSPRLGRDRTPERLSARVDSRRRPGWFKCWHWDGRYQYQSAARQTRPQARYRPVGLARDHTFSRPCDSRLPCSRNAQDPNITLLVLVRSLVCFVVHALGSLLHGLSLFWAVTSLIDKKRKRPANQPPTHPPPPKPSRLPSFPQPHLLHLPRTDTLLYCTLRPRSRHRRPRRGASAALRGLGVLGV